MKRIRSGRPRTKILEAAKIALMVDDEPNSDLIEYIAGYAPRSAIYHYFSNMHELFDSLGAAKKISTLATPKLSPGQLDLATCVPPVITGAIVHMDDMEPGRGFCVWQKINGGMRAVILNRAVNRTLFLAGVVLYAGEGTKSLKSGRVEVANSNPGVLRLHIRFMEGLGLSKKALRARVQIHSSKEMRESRDLWARELVISPSQFVRPLLSTPGGIAPRRTFTLQLSYSSTMLLLLLRHWTEDVDRLIQGLDRE